jgi:hypothetical protein
VGLVEGVRQWEGLKVCVGVAVVDRHRVGLGEGEEELEPEAVPDMVTDTVPVKPLSPDMVCEVVEEAVREVVLERHREGVAELVVVVEGVPTRSVNV